MPCLEARDELRGPAFFTRARDLKISGRSMTYLRPPSWCARRSLLVALVPPAPATNAADVSCPNELAGRSPGSGGAALVSPAPSCPRVRAAYARCWRRSLCTSKPPPPPPPSPSDTKRGAPAAGTGGAPPPDTASVSSQEPLKTGTAGTAGTAEVSGAAEAAGDGVAGVHKGGEGAAAGGGGMLPHQFTEFYAGRLVLWRVAPSVGRVALALESSRGSASLLWRLVSIIDDASPESQVHDGI